MKNTISKIKGYLHFHNFTTPIVSRYMGFNSREIIYECKCGLRDSRYVRRACKDAFPIPTSSFDIDKDFQTILENKVPHKLHKVDGRVIFVEYLK